MNSPRPLTCQEAVVRLDDFLDRELSNEETLLVQQHLETCAHCAEFYVFEGAVLEDLKAKIRRIDLPPEVIDKVRAVLKSA